MHVGAWLERLARSEGEPRDRLVAALATLGPDAGDGLHAARGRGRHSSRPGILAAPMAELERRWRAARSPRSSPSLDLPDAAAGA